MVRYQIEYTSELQGVPVKGRGKDLVPKHLVKEVLGLYGALCWVAIATVPAISLRLSKIGTQMRAPTVNTVRRLEGIVRELKESKPIIKYEASSWRTPVLVAEGDAAIGNLEGGGSQGGCLVSIRDVETQNPTSHLLAHQSKRIKRVVWSSMSAETVNQTAMMDTALWIRDMIRSVTRVNLRVVVKTDCESYRSAVHSLSNVRKEKRLTLDVYAMREALRTGQIFSVSHVKSDQNNADGLTKHSKSTAVILYELAAGKVRDTWRNGAFDPENTNSNRR